MRKTKQVLQQEKEIIEILVEKGYQESEAKKILYDFLEILNDRFLREEEGLNILLTLKNFVVKKEVKQGLQYFTHQKQTLDFITKRITVRKRSKNINK